MAVWRRLECCLARCVAVCRVHMVCVFCMAEILYLLPVTTVAVTASYMWSVSS